MRNVLLLRNTEYVERWYCYLFIAYIFFTLLNMGVIILVNIFYCSCISRPLVENLKRNLPALPSISIYWVPPDLKRKKKKKKKTVSHLFGSTVFADFYLNSVMFPHYFTSKCMLSLQTFLFIFANKCSSFHNCLFLILN